MTPSHVLGMRRCGAQWCAAIAIAAALGGAGCGRRAGPPAIRMGDTCDLCAMEVESLRFACERQVGKEWRVYDSIECLLRDGGSVAAIGAWLPDYDRQDLHPADSLWVVQGSFPTPMGGGYAAFLSRADADSLAVRTGGTVARLERRAAAGVGK